MHVLVTGASSGIGEAIARAFAGRGAKVSLAARRLDKLQALAADLPAESVALAVDLSDPEACAGLLSEAEAALGPVDVLVNNAGVQVIGPTGSVDYAGAAHLSPFQRARALVPRHHPVVHGSDDASAALMLRRAQRSARMTRLSKLRGAAQSLKPKWLCPGPTRGSGSSIERKG